MKWAVAVAGVSVVVLGSMSYLQSRAIWRAGVIYSRVELNRALTDIRETGGLRDHGNSLRPYLYTNVLTVNGTNYTCVVAYEDVKFYGKGFLAATTNGDFLYLDKKRGPRLIPATGRF